MASDRPEASNSNQVPGSESTQKSAVLDWVLPAIAAAIVVKVFGLVGGLVTFGTYYWLKPKVGVWAAMGASGVLGAVAAFGVAAMIR